MLSRSFKYRLIFMREHEQSELIKELLPHVVSVLKISRSSYTQRICLKLLQYMINFTNIDFIQQSIPTIKGIVHC